MLEYDIIIIGSGPAGLTAGIYAGRTSKKTLLIDKSMAGGVGRKVPIMENYPGFETISGMVLIEKIRNQCLKNAEINEVEKITEILKLSNEEYNFKIITDKNEYLTKAIIIATGSKYRKLNIEGEEEFLGKGVSYCATCDGFFFKDQDVAIIGGGNSALQEAIYLNELGCNVTIIHRRDKFRADDYLQKKVKELNINIIYNSIPLKIQGENILDSIILKDNENKELKLNVNGVFIAIGSDPQIEIAKTLNVAIDKNNYIITDKKQKTNIEFVYSAGDVTGGIKQWIVASSEGAISAISAFDDLER